jgi:acyl-CoA synthetase (AMP-forming)/AMP-acid ligase II
MDGYFRNETKTKEAITDGFLRTGDLGFIHNGELFITGRAKELIIKRGRNYYPDDLEFVAEETAGTRVQRAAAFSCANDSQGTEDIVLVLEAKAMSAQEKDLLEKDIHGALIAAFGIRADTVICVAPRTISRTTSGKVQRTALRARYMAGEIAQNYR